MIIDIHGHYTTYPPGVEAYRGAQVAQMGAPTRGKMNVTDDEIRGSIENGQLKVQRERGTDLTLFSPRASWMGHHFGGALISRYWIEHTNDLVYRVQEMFPDNFVGVCALPQSPGTDLKNSIAEVERCVTQLGFVGCNVSPDTSGGYWQEPPFTDRYWYPLWEKLVELDVPAMVHVSATCNPAFHQTGSHYLNADTTSFMQFMQTPSLFKDFPGLRFIIPHGGGAVPYHWGRYRGMNLDQGRPELTELLMHNIWFDTCVYHQPGMDLLFKVVHVDSIMFASEMIGAVRGKDPNTGFYFDDTKRYVDAVGLSEAESYKVYEGTARKVYPRLDARLKARGK
jgi:4-oxalmesaconate hydratase